MGTIMMPTTSPAMNSDAVTGGLTTLKIGMNPRWCDSQLLNPTTIRFFASSDSADFRQKKQPVSRSPSMYRIRHGAQRCSMTPL